jgi:hypothetical protein
MKYRKYEDYHRIENGIEQKKCQDCNDWYDLNETNFGIVKKNNDGFNVRCKVCQKKHNEEYYAETREQQIELALKRHYDNHEEECKRKLEWHRKNPERHKYLIEKFRKNNKEHIQDYGINYRQTERGKQKYKIYGENHREKEHRISEAEWEECKKYFNYRCAYCGLPIEQHYVPRKKKMVWQDFHREHVIHDGRIDIKNCVPSCNSCNSKKKKQSLNAWYNLNNPNYTYERYHKIYMWLRYDYKKYIKKRKPKGKYEKKNKEYWINNRKVV